MTSILSNIRDQNRFELLLNKKSGAQGLGGGRDYTRERVSEQRHVTHSSFDPENIPSLREKRGV